MGKAAVSEARGRARRGEWRGAKCAFDGCAEPVSCKGFCRSHYGKDRWARGVRSPSVNPRSQRARRIKHRYGVTIEEYEAACVKQQGRCAVCGEPPSRKNTRAHWDGKLCIDHDHSTGKLRGLLCNDCNLTVGYGKTPEILQRAARYLLDHA